MVSGVLVAAGLFIAADNPEDLSTGLRIAGFSFLVFMTSVLMKIESK
ncbi:MAG: hypothetical protein AAB582_00230 [Patescibacteria group bacterium]